MRALDVPYRVASRITGEVDASWPGRQYEAATGTGRLTLTPTRTSAAASAMPVGGSIAIDANGSLALANVRNVRVAAASVNGRVELTDRRRLAGVLRARADNVQATVSALEAFLGRRAGSLTPVAVEGALSTDARIGGTIDAPLVTADLHAPSLSLGEITDVSAVGTDLTWRGGKRGCRRAARWAFAAAAPSTCQSEPMQCRCPISSVPSAALTYLPTVS
jgi:hypothetical protein